MNVNGRTVLLTGASRGLGAMLAVRLAERHAQLVLAARDAGKLDAVASRCTAFGVRVKTIAADVANAGDRQRLVNEAGDVDVLINNAGVETAIALIDQTREEVESQIATNLLAPIELSRLLLPGMVAKRRGVIVNISSMSGKSATPFNSVYSATKFGLIGFTGSLRIELQRTGVHAGVVCPGFVAERGMWADHGVRAPRMMREVSPEKVVQAVFRVISGAGEVLVTPGPIRPLLALREMFPALDRLALERLGILDAFRRRAEAAATSRLPGAHSSSRAGREGTARS